MFLLHSNLIYKSSLVGGFSIRLNDTPDGGYILLGHTVYKIRYTTAEVHCRMQLCF